MTVFPKTEAGEPESEPPVSSATVGTGVSASSCPQAANVKASDRIKNKYLLFIENELPYFLL
jgi:hypothetical protein